MTPYAEGKAEGERAASRFLDLGGQLHDHPHEHAEIVNEAKRRGPPAHQVAFPDRFAWIQGYVQGFLARAREPLYAAPRFKLPTIAPARTWQVYGTVEGYPERKALLVQADALAGEHEVLIAAVEVGRESHPGWTFTRAKPVDTPAEQG